MELFDLSNRTALVVGGGSGLGEAMALGLAEAGAHVVVTGRNAVKLMNTVNKIKDNGGAATSYVIDVQNTDSVNTTVDLIAKKSGSIDILVNSA
ncbi:MAG TPA: SDR family NAD(P)-dependent oxidoreductase, partial [Thermodesulfobacteriota bacterium]|nr:SDR family NAD(P)-dependent oxidoreductase [Thermodesulfobacteriota bacterium]